MLIYLLKSAFIGADAFNERHGKRIELIGLMSFVDNGQRHAEVEDLQVAHFFGQGDDLGQEVDPQTQNVAPAADARPLSVDGEDAARHSEIALLHFARPVFEDLLRVELQTEAVAVRLQFLSFDVILPTFACNMNMYVYVLG